MRTIGLAVLSVVAVIALVAVLVAVGVFGSIFGAHVNAYVAKKTLGSNVTSTVFQAGNAIGSQSYFEQTYQDVQAFEGQISVQKGVVAASPSAYNETNLAAMKLGCIKAVTNYNAAAKSISQAPFRSADLPPSLKVSLCT